MALLRHTPKQAPGDNRGFLKPKQVLDALEISPGMRVADFGCGSGFFVIPLAERVGSAGIVYALDIQHAALEAVRSEARLKNLHNVKAIWADLEVPESSKINASTVDMVLVSNILFQAEKKEQVLREARRILKPQGTLVVIEWRDDVTLGPPKDLRMPQSVALNLVRGVGFSYIKELDLGPTHYGLIFRNP